MSDCEAVWASVLARGGWRLRRLPAGRRDVLELLAALAGKSVVIVQHGEGGDVRYRLPEPLLASRAEPPA